MHAQEALVLNEDRRPLLLPLSTEDGGQDANIVRTDSEGSPGGGPLPQSRWRDLARVVLFGQLISLCTCGTGVTSQALASNHSISIPTSQSFANYLLLAIVYTTVLVRKGTFVHTFRERGLRYLLVAVIDVEANYTIVKAYQYTSLTSIQLLDCFTIFAVMVLSYFVLKSRFAQQHIFGVAVCVLGLGALVGADIKTDRNAGPSRKPDRDRDRQRERETERDSERQ
jgi:hypothetical protein